MYSRIFCGLGIGRNLPSQSRSVLEEVLENPTKGSSDVVASRRKHPSSRDSTFAHPRIPSSGFDLRVIIVGRASLLPAKCVELGGWHDIRLNFAKRWSTLWLLCKSDRQPVLHE